MIRGLDYLPWKAIGGVVPQSLLSSPRANRAICSEWLVTSISGRWFQGVGNWDNIRGGMGVG